MPFTDKIVEHINQSLKAGSLKDKRFQPGKFYGITTILARHQKVGNGLELLPAMEKDGQYDAIGVDDRINITLYHKVVANSYTMQKKGGYGDDYLHKCSAEMLLVILADERKVKLKAEQLEPMVIYGMPNGFPLTDTGLSSCIISPLGSTMDRLIVFRQEYPGTEFFLKPYHHLFSIRYRIETSFDKNCIDNCLCGPAEA
jgi:hypothetical protein